MLPSALPPQGAIKPFPLPTVAKAAAFPLKKRAKRWESSVPPTLGACPLSFGSFCKAYAEYKARLPLVCRDIWHNAGADRKLAEHILCKRGLSVSAKFSVKMPDTWTPIFDLSDKNKVRRTNEAAEGQIDRIIGAIKNRACGDFMKKQNADVSRKSIFRIGI